MDAVVAVPSGAATACPPVRGINVVGQRGAMTRLQILPCRVVWKRLISSLLATTSPSRDLAQVVPVDRLGSVAFAASESNLNLRGPDNHARQLNVDAVDLREHASWFRSERVRSSH